jgi:hypothetical protein
VTLSAQIQCARDDWTLLTPGHTTGDELARDCIAALDLIVPQVNDVVGPMVRDLLGGAK